MREKIALFFLILLVLAVPMIVCGQSHSFGLVIQGTDYDSVKDQTTFHLLNVSGKQINALDLSFQVKLPDGTFTEPGTSFAVIDYLEAGLAPGAVEQIQKPGIVIGVVDLVMYSDGTADIANEGVHKTIIAGRKGRVQANQHINDLINAALADPNEKHPSEKVVAQLKAELASKTVNGGYGVELLDAIQNITNRYGSPYWTQAWEAEELKGLAKLYRDRAATLKAVLK